MSDVEFCPLSKIIMGMTGIIKKGRTCSVDGVVCFYWDDPNIYKNCPIRKRGRQ